MLQTAALLSLALAGVRAQQIGTSTAEVHPSLTWETCTGTGGTSCTSVAGSITLDANWRWLHTVGGVRTSFVLFLQTSELTFANRLRIVNRFLVH